MTEKALTSHIESFERELSEIQKTNPSLEELPKLIERGRSLVADMVVLAVKLETLPEMADMREQIKELIGDTLIKIT